jgi:hypothetical protein
MEIEKEQPFQCKNEEKILLVEGKDDAYVSAELCRIYDLPSKYFCIQDCKSNSKLLSKINGLLRASEKPKIVGIVLDADESVEKRWQQITKKLTDISLNYKIPKDINSKGTIIEAINSDEEEFPKIGIWIMPNNEKEGMLEDFLMEMAEQSNYKGGIQYAKECVENAKEKNFTSFKDVHKSKAIVHTYLAWHNEPSFTFGNAIKEKEGLNPNIPPVQDFIDWLKNLFEIKN